MEAEFEGVSHLFWAVELVPGKEYTTTVPAELRITQAVLPASAKDTGRSVVSIQFSSEEDGEKEKAIAIASLRLDNQDSQALEVMVDDDSTITLSVSGKNPVHLSGYYVPDDNEGEDDFYGDDEVDSDELGSEEEEEEDEEAEEAAQKAMAAQLAKKRQAQQQNGGDNKKAKVEAAAAPKQQQQPKKQQEAQPKKQQQPQQKTPQAKVYPNGLQTTTTREGQGAEATKGRRVSVKYVGKLTKNNKVFDASTKPFTFTLGAHEVISGWDLGVAGMKVGEKRTLVIPSELGYGKKGAGKDIPPNSSLTFDVELLHVK